MMYQLTNQHAGYIWCDKFILPYESLWGITEKFKYINVILNIKNLVKSSACLCVEDEDNYIYRERILYDNKTLYNFFGIKSNHFDGLKIFKGNTLNTFLSTTVKFCPKCMKFGYHSYFHQLIFYEKCFIHKEEELRLSLIPYSINYFNNVGFFSNSVTKEYICSSFDVLESVIDDKFKIPERCSLFSDEINHIKIVNLDKMKLISSNEKFKASLKMICSGYLSENTIEEYSKNTTYFLSNDMNFYPEYYDSKREIYRNWFSDYCYNICKRLYALCDKSIMRKTLMEFNSSTLTTNCYNYNKEAISIIIIAAILTGYKHPSEMSNIFSSRWSRRYYECFYNDVFAKLINLTEHDFEKIAYVKIYKHLICIVINKIYENALQDKYSGKTYRQIETDIDIPIYFIVEKNDNICIIEQKV